MNEWMNQWMNEWMNESSSSFSLAPFVFEWMGQTVAISYWALPYWHLGHALLLNGPTLLSSTLYSTVSLAGWRLCSWGSVSCSYRYRFVRLVLLWLLVLFWDSSGILERFSRDSREILERFLEGDPRGSEAMTGFEILEDSFKNSLRIL